MMKEMPTRTFDVGIAEQHAVTFAAGMAANGMIPVCAIYSSFMQRAYDQLVHDVALQKLPVIFCLDRAGLVGDDGATHHGVFDIAYMRSIPNLVISAPMNEEELRNLMFTAVTGKHGAFSIRYPRGKGVMINWQTEMHELEIGKGRMVSDGKYIAILSIGHPGNFVQEAIKLLGEALPKPAHFDMRFVKPLDTDLLHHIFTHFKHIITVEDGVIAGGFGSAVLEFMAENNYQAQVSRLGVPDTFIEHGTPAELQQMCGFDALSIAHKVLEIAANISITAKETVK
jgi:1-deoxy-D-xylulose-5-phosphate synthase